MEIAGKPCVTAPCLAVGRIFYMMYLMYFSDENLVVVDMPWVAFNPFSSKALPSSPQGTIL